jgi:hypothetical protein
MNARKALATIAVGLALGGSLALMSCKAAPGYDSITRIEFSRGWVTQSLTKSDGTRVPGGCWYTAASSQSEASSKAVFCYRQADGLRKPGGGFAGFVATEAPSELFKSLVAVLAKANALDLDSPPSRPAGYANDTYTLMIDSGNTTKAFAVDVSASHRLSPAESAIIDVWMQLHAVMSRHMRISMVE